LVGLGLSQAFSHNAGVLTMGSLCLLLTPVVLRIQ